MSNINSFSLSLCIFPIMWLYMENESQYLILFVFLSRKQCSLFLWYKGRCRDEAAKICPATTFVYSRVPSEAYVAGSPCRLADWSSGPLVRIHSRRCPSHPRTCSIFLWLFTLTVLFSLASATLKTSTDYSGDWFKSRTQKSLPHHHW